MRCYGTNRQIKGNKYPLSQRKYPPKLEIKPISKKSDSSIFKKIIIYTANNPWVILIVYVTSILISSSLFAIFEQKSFWDGMWWSFVTALTIGYGDISPVTLSGRVVGVIFSHFWIFAIIPMIIANIIANILEDKSKFTHEEQEWQEAAFKAIANKVGVELPPSPRDY